MKKTIVRPVAMTLAAAVGFGMSGLVSGSPVNADWSKNMSNTAIGVSQIGSPVDPRSDADPTGGNTPWSGSYVYFGKYDGEPIRFRVLAPTTTEFGGTTMFLDSDLILYEANWSMINTGGQTNDWNSDNCDIRNNLNFTQFLLASDGFTSYERISIAQSTRAGGVDYPEGSGLESLYGHTVGLEGDQIFLLDAEDLFNPAYGYGGALRGASDIPNRAKVMRNGRSDWYYLRSPNIAADSTNVSVGAVHDRGYFASLNAGRSFGIAPALNVDLDDVLFSSLVSGTAGQPGAEYKLTVATPEFSVAKRPFEEITISGSTVSVPYEVIQPNSHPCNRVSVFIVDKLDYRSANMLYYGALTPSGEDRGTFTLPSGLSAEGWGTDYFVYMVAEQVNGPHETDYACAPVRLNYTYHGSTQPTTAPTAAPTAIPNTEPTASGFVERLYTVALGRSSDPAGAADWVAAITERGETGADAARGFLYSDEFLNKDVTTEEFVRILYVTFFDREPDTDGFNAWVNALNNGSSKRDVIEGFINSTEWANLCLRYGIASGGTGVPNIEVEPNQQTIDFCTRLYTTCLNRNADEAGLMAWARQLANRRDSGSGAARGFFFSDEFVNQNVSNGEFVNRLYRTFMGREADEAGYTAWVAQLEQGESRETVFMGFAESPEFTRICASYGIIG
ncbi:MAG: DUF4214 domain-containing protein [Clostridiales bacterium]|nr:DUF4214 domain-containing protein [Clostridiales bacterium]